jgi:hypothetical protein
VAIKLAVTLALTYVLSHELPLLPRLLPYASKEREVEIIDLETGEKVVELPPPSLCLKRKRGRKNRSRNRGKGC